MREEKVKAMGIYAAIIGLIYLFISIMEIFGGIYNVPKDIFGGLVLLVIAATYLTGVKRALKGECKGLSFLIAGVFLSSVFGILYILILFANWLEYLIGNASFSFYLRPEIWLFFAILPLAYLIKKEIRW